MTDPQKFVFEDVAIAAYLITLWEAEEEAEEEVEVAEGTTRGVGEAGSPKNGKLKEANVELANKVESKERGNEGPTNEIDHGRDNGLSINERPTFGLFLHVDNNSSGGLLDRSLW